MNTPLEQSRAYAELGMIDEALEAAEEALRTGCDEEIARTWLVILAYKSGDFRQAAALGTELLARGFKRRALHTYTTLAMHHLGQSREAASLLLGLDEHSRGSFRSYQIASFLSATGDSEEALRHLLASLPDFRDEREKTWLDGDLKALWTKLASGHFTLETAHLLIEQEFDVLREWQPGTGTHWKLDPSNYSVLPDDLRAVVRLDPKDEAYVIDYSKAPPGSERAAQFERWARWEVRSNQENFDRARRVAWEHVLDAQPGYALAAWRRGDLCATRNHVMWSLENQPERIADYFDLPELAPMIDEMSRMLDSDWDFFSKLSRTYRLYKKETDAAFDILDSFPKCWRSHPFLEQVRGHCLEASGNPVEGLACLLRACDHSPQDVATIKDGTHQTPKYVPCGIPFFSVEHVTSGDFKNTKFISEQEHRFLTRSFKIEKGDILMTRIGSIGDCKLIDWEVDASFYVSLALLKIHPGYSAEYIAHYSKSASFQKEVELHSLQSAIPKKINLGPISNVRIELPPLPEQTAIAAVLSEMDAELAALEQRREKTRALKQAMMQELLTGRTRLV